MTGETGLCARGTILIKAKMGAGNLLEKFDNRIGTSVTWRFRCLKTYSKSILPRQLCGL